MAIQPLNGNGPGDIEQAKKKLQGRGPSLTQPVQGDPARAARMQAQFDQPVTGPNGVVKQPQAPSIDMQGSTLGRVVDGAKAAYQVAKPLLSPVATAADVLTAAPADYLRNAAIRAAGGDPATSEGGETANRDRAFGNVKPAIDMVSSIGNAVRGGVSSAVLSATGAQPAVAAPAVKSQPLSKPVVAPKVSTAPKPGAAAPQPAGNGYAQTGIAGIAGRVGANGVPEFTNDKAALAGAAAKPSAGISRVGDGIGGGISHGQAGDAALALGRFERANQERALMNANRPREIGDNGGRVTVVRDSSRAPSIAELQHARMDERTAQSDALRNRSDIDQQRLGLDSRELDRNLANDQINQQKARQEIEVGGYGLDATRRLDQLRQQMADPSIQGAERASLEAAYASLTEGSKDRYMAVTGGTNEFGGKDASKVLDRRTGKYIDAGSQSPGQAATPAVGEERGGYIFKGGDPRDKNNWSAK